MKFSEAVWQTPLVVAIVLLPIRNQRHGSNSGPSYVNRASMTARNKARKFLETYFEIVTKPVSETGWMLGGDHTLKI